MVWARGLEMCWLTSPKKVSGTKLANCEKRHSSWLLLADLGYLDHLVEAEWISNGMLNQSSRPWGRSQQLELLDCFFR
jgi:hypothetical protein